MRVLIVGDVHGQHELLAELLRQVRADYRIEAAIQVGDFGFFRERLAQLRWAGRRWAVPLHVIDGNHEDHAWLQQALAAGEADVWAKELNLIYQARPSIARLGGTTIGFLGGALHVDRPQEHNWLAGLPNYLLPRHRQAAVELFNQHRPELIVTHSCPAGIGVGMCGAPELQASVAQFVTAAGFSPGPPNDCGERELDLLWQQLRHRPRAWVFGHFHRPHQASVADTLFLCVEDDLETPRRRLVIWDTEEKRVLLCPADPSLLPH